MHVSEIDLFSRVIGHGNLLSIFCRPTPAFVCRVQQHPSDLLLYNESFQKQSFSIFGVPWEEKKKKKKARFSVPANGGGLSAVEMALA